MNRTVDKVQDGKKRYTEVDIARGIGILFVVLGLKRLIKDLIIWKGNIIGNL